MSFCRRRTLRLGATNTSGSEPDDAAWVATVVSASAICESFRMVLAMFKASADNSYACLMSSRSRSARAAMFSAFSSHFRPVLLEELQGLLDGRQRRRAVTVRLCWTDAISAWILASVRRAPRFSASRRSVQDRQGVLGSVRVVQRDGQVAQALGRDDVEVGLERGGRRLFSEDLRLRKMSLGRDDVAQGELRPDKMERALEGLCRHNSSLEVGLRLRDSPWPVKCDPFLMSTSVCPSIFEAAT